MQQIEHWQSRALYRILQSWNIACVVLLVISAVVGYATLLTTSVLLLLIATCTTGLWLLTQGNRSAAVYVVALAFYIGLTALLLVRGGIEIPAAMFVVVPIMLFALMGMPREARFAAITSALIYAIVFGLWLAGYVARPAETFLPGVWFVVLLMFLAIVAALMIYSASAVQKNERTIQLQLKKLAQQRDNLNTQLKTIQKNEQRFRFVLDNAADAVYITNAVGKIIDANEQACKALKYTYAELTRLHARHISADPDISKFLDDLQVNAVTSVSRRTNHRRKDGEVFPVDSSVAVAEIDGETVFITVSRDISDRIETERMLNQAQRMQSLGVLAGGVAHDFNNLLVAMLGQSSLALRMLPAEANARRPIEKTINAAEKAAALTRQMLAFSGRGHFQMEQLDLNRLVAENDALLRVSLPTGVTLQTTFGSDVPAIVGDASQIQQVIMNLIINAGEAVDPQNGLIRVNTQSQDLSSDDLKYQPFTSAPLKPGKYAVLEVSDNGVGMTSETQQKIFDPFFTTKKTGHGLGLAALLGIIRGHKGGLIVYSELGKGTNFKVVFPAETLAVIANDTTQTPLDTGQLLGTGTVLIIDDDPLSCETATDILSETGYQILSANDGVSGIEQCMQQLDEIGLIMLDLNLPDLKANEVLDKIRRLSETVPVVLVSGYSYVDVLPLMLGRSYIAFLQKPYTTLELQSVVKQYIV